MDGDLCGAYLEPLHSRDRLENRNGLRVFLTWLTAPREATRLYLTPYAAGIGMPSMHPAL